MDFLAYIIVPLLLGLWAQWKVKGTFDRWSEVGSRSGATGKEAAEEVLRAEGITGVTIERVDGYLSDHYDPSNRKLRLSSQNYDGTSVAALGVAAHEAGHAIQHARAYAPLQLRSLLVPVTIVANKVAFFAILLGAFLFTQGGNGTMLNIAIGAYAVITVFTLITLPVEFDASARANRALVAAGLLDREESKGAKEVLDAAAWTYIAGFVAALGNLLWLFSRRE
ncbi:MAG: zinc metallopeptidase [Opitutia bacterium]|jgi:Zn-dependent membrane protease YugP